MDVLQVVVIVATAVVNAAVTLAVVRVELRYLRRDVDAAHARMDAAGIPARWQSARGES